MPLESFRWSWQGQSWANSSVTTSQFPSVVLYCFFCLFVFQVDRQPQFIQGYRVMYRQTSGLQASTAWQNLDAKVTTERSAVLVNLKKGVTYEIKVRPYFNEFQGMDSESKTIRTPEEGQ